MNEDQEKKCNCGEPHISEMVCHHYDQTPCHLKNNKPCEIQTDKPEKIIFPTDKSYFSIREDIKNGKIKKDHQKPEPAPESDWEKEFDKIFRYGEQAPLTNKLNELKFFIRNLLATQKSEIVKKLEGMNCEVPQEPKNVKKLTNAWVDKILLYVGRFNYNKALSDAIQTIKDL